MDGAAREVLDDGAAWGERFVAPVGVPEGPGWTSADALFGPGLDEALAGVADARDTANLAVAGSLLFETYAQRLVAPVLGAWFVDGRVLDARLSRVRAERIAPGVRRVAFAGPPVATAEPDDEALRRLRNGLVEQNLQVAARAVHHGTRLGWRVLQGAIAHAVAISFLHLSWPRPDHDRHVGDARDFLSGVPGLADLVEIEAVVEGGRRWMSCYRNTCCLAFRIVGAGTSSTCALCPLRSRAATREMVAQATASYTDRHPDL
ncbi:hypothetical protein [Actinomycetospora sp. TBRC 11914]|uniref:hypothetical protein n=1 Tax=Actinomycetospora sp. TBRC 11914 TaxID=2729387 RepID=UPI00145F3F0F|nr:hypothetical protein [Actinomycetospora sp. TBRC 11914]NMO94080.1 hypothetical protein [Actinomycetospora sp. TBRC 11914]